MLFSYINRIGTTYYYIVNNKFLYNWSKRSVYSSEHGDDYGLTFIKSEINYNRSLTLFGFIYQIIIEFILQHLI